jgi:hypothetical protein
MGELERLIKRAHNYDKSVLNEFGNFNNFYSKAKIFHTRYEEILSYYTRKLEYVGNGACSYVYRMNRYVLKLHVPYDKKINLKAAPTDSRIFHARDREFHFLFHEYTSENGLGAVQKYIDCSREAQIKAYKILTEKGLEINTKSNCGMNEGAAWIVDWQ